MPNEYSVRECQPGEGNAVLALWQQAEASVSVTDTMEHVQRAVMEGPASVLVAERDGQIVGSIIGAFDGWRGNIYRLAVLPAYRRQGVARRLLAEVEHRMAGQGVKRILALVEKDHPWATGYWDAVGYERDPRYVLYVKNL